jgi:hypothetical protein
MARFLNRDQVPKLAQGKRNFWNWHGGCLVSFILSKYVVIQCFLSARVALTLDTNQVQT